MKKIFLLALTVVWLNSLQASLLFGDKKTHWTIIVSPQCSTTELYAATELQTYLQRISGAEFPVKRSGTIPAKNALVIGTAASFAALPAAVKDFPEGVSGHLQTFFRNTLYSYCDNRSQTRLG